MLQVYLKEVLIYKCTHYPFISSDPSIGSKTGINSKYGKNLIGVFINQFVVSDIQFLKSLPKREIICGYGEILKHSLINNKKLFFF